MWRREGEWKGETESGNAQNQVEVGGKLASPPVSSPLSGMVSRAATGKHNVSIYREHVEYVGYTFMNTHNNVVSSPIKSTTITHVVGVLLLINKTVSLAVGMSRSVQK